MDNSQSHHGYKLQLLLKQKLKPKTEDKDVHVHQTSCDMSAKTVQTC